MADKWSGAALPGHRACRFVFAAKRIALAGPDCCERSPSRACFGICGGADSTLDCPGAFKFSRRSAGDDGANGFYVGAIHSPPNEEGKWRIQRGTAWESPAISALARGT